MIVEWQRHLDKYAGTELVDANQVNADVEYVGHIEEILELNYRRHCLSSVSM